MPHPNASSRPLKARMCSAPFINLLITKLISISVTARSESISKSWPGCLATFVVRFLLDHVSNRRRWSSYYLNKSNIKGTAVAMGALPLLSTPGSCISHLPEPTLHPEHPRLLSHSGLLLPSFQSLRMLFRGGTTTRVCSLSCELIFAQPMAQSLDGQGRGAWGRMGCGGLRASTGGQRQHRQALSAPRRLCQLCSVPTPAPLSPRAAAPHAGSSGSLA